MRRVTLDQARRAALGAQGLIRSLPAGRVDRRHFGRLFADIGLLQLDSVNVLERSHYLPVLARLGPYDKASLDAFTVESGAIFEYWGHEASLLPVALYPYLRHRMDSFRPWRSARGLMEEHPGYVDEVYDEVVRRGPLTVGDLDDEGDRTGPWWGYGKGKVALEWLFGAGRISAFRTKNFTRVYDLPERVLPPEIVALPAVEHEEALRVLLLRSARHHALGTASDLADYYRLHVPTARAMLAAMAAAGDIVEVDVPSWKGPVYADPDMVIPRRTGGSALLSPFDPVVWARDRTERLFGFHYRIEIYVPQPKRKYGYYVLPYLLDGELVGRVDLKADRKTRVLRVQAAFLEEGRDGRRVGKAMKADIETMAAWLGMHDVVDMRRGNLALR